MPGRARCSVILPSETQSREFDAKLLLACALAERGLPTYVGSRIAIHARISCFPRSVYIAKDFRKPSHRIFRILAGLGHRILGWDEEGILFFSAKAFHERRIHVPAFQMVEELFAWGPQNAQFLQSAPGYRGVPIHDFGNPRIDMLRPELRGFYDAEVAALKQRFGSFILVNTNFGRLNHAVPKYVVRPDGKDHSVGGTVTPYMRNAWTHRLKIFEAFQAMLPKLAAAFPDKKIVVRPHPAESHDAWRRAAGGNERIIVSHEGAVYPWLLACGAMIHNGCTTGIEGYFLGAPVISYRPVKSDEFDLGISNNLSLQVETEAELCAAIARRSKPERTAATETEMQKIIAPYFSSVTGPLATDRIADAVSEFISAQADAGTVTFQRRVLARADAALRALTKAVAQYIPNHKNSHAYNIQRFPGVSLEQTNDRIKRFQRLLGRFSNVSAQQVAKNVYLVK